MKDNVIVSENGNEVYVSEILQLSDEYINSLDNPEVIYSNNKMYFVGMLKYINYNYFHQNKVDYDDADMIYKIWYIYTSLCYKYGKRPTLLNFSVFIGIEPVTFYTWKEGDYRQYVYYDSNNNRIKDIESWRLNHKGEDYTRKLSHAHSNLVKKMLSESESALLDGAIEQSSIGCIFSLKALYGYAETAPVNTNTTRPQMLTAADLPRLPDAEPSY